jgi:WD40 repeat protein
MLVISTIIELFIVNPDTEDILNRWPFPNLDILSLAVLDDDLLATKPYFRDDKINILNIKTGEKVRDLIILDHRYKEKKIFALPNGFLASNNPITIWDPYKGNLLRTFENDESSISLSVLKNGLLASSGEDGWLRIWEMETGLKLKSFHYKKAMNYLTVESNGYLVGASETEIIIMDCEKFNSNQETQFISDLARFFYYQTIFSASHHLILNLKKKHNQVIFL